MMKMVARAECQQGNGALIGLACASLPAGAPASSFVRAVSLTCLGRASGRASERGLLGPEAKLIKSPPISSPPFGQLRPRSRCPMTSVAGRAARPFARRLAKSCHWPVGRRKLLGRPAALPGEELRTTHIDIHASSRAWPGPRADREAATTAGASWSVGSGAESPSTGRVDGRVETRTRRLCKGHTERAPRSQAKQPVCVSRT